MLSDISVTDHPIYLTWGRCAAEYPRKCTWCNSEVQCIQYEYIYKNSECSVIYKKISRSESDILKSSLPTMKAAFYTPASFTNVFSLLQTETMAWFLIFVHLCSEELIF